MMNCVQKYQSLGKTKMNLLKNFLLDLCIFVIDFLWMIGPRSVNYFILHLTSLTNETYQLEDEEYDSFLNATLHVDFDLHENVENTNELVEDNVFGYLFTLGDTD